MSVGRKRTSLGGFGCTEAITLESVQTKMELDGSVWYSNDDGMTWQRADQTDIDTLTQHAAVCGQTLFGYLGVVR